MARADRRLRVCATPLWLRDEAFACTPPAGHARRFSFSGGTRREGWRCSETGGSGVDCFLDMMLNAAAATPLWLRDEAFACTPPAVMHYSYWFPRRTARRESECGAGRGGGG
jgi:hypothetical protein